MKNVLIFSLILSGFVVTSCGPSRQKQADRIASMEKSIYSQASAGFSQQRADSLLAMYDEFIREFPDDSLAPGYLFKAANITMNAGNGAKAIELFEQYMQQYPEKPKAAICLFFKGFVYENLIHDLDKAREVYLLFIEKYPADEFADDARMAIQNLGKTPEMLIREFEQRAREDSLRKADSIAKLSGKK